MSEVHIFIGATAFLIAYVAYRIGWTHGDDNGYIRGIAAMQPALEEAYEAAVQKQHDESRPLQSDNLKRLDLRNAM